MPERYSIWTIPPEPVKSQLQAIIIGLSRNHRGPVFEPHMTLIGDVKKDKEAMIETTEALAEGLTELKLSLGEISFGTTFFQSVFIKVLATAELMELNLKANRLLGTKNNVFLPHISLLYGDHDIISREKIAISINFLRTTIFVSEFIVVPSTSDTSEWTHIAHIPFREG